MQKALAGLPAAQRQALEAAAHRVRVYHEKQRLEGWSYTEADGTMLGQMITPLDRVGLYVPGGKAAYPSSVLMNAIPAKVAGVKELIMVVPTPGGEHNPLVLAAACLAGVDRVFTIGGAQAVGALAYGTQTVPQVDKIVGPGNAYVACAKRRVFGVVGIDMVAGPSEILVVSDGSTDPDWVAMDLFSQAEHDELAQSILICTDAAFIERVAGQHRKTAADHAAPRSHRNLAEESRRADPGARSGGSCRHRQPRRTGTPRTGAGRSRSLGGKNPPRRRHLHRPLHLGVARRLLRGPEPRAADFRQRPLLVAARRLRFPEADQPDQGLAGRRADAGPHRRDAGAWRRLAGPCQVGRVAPGTLMPPETAPPPDLKALFLGFSSVGLSGFGGVLPFARRMLVEERRWMTAEEFNAQFGLCQFLPGPNVINLAVVVGKRYQGLLGAIVAPVGLLAGPLVIVLLLALLYDHYGSLPLAQSLLRGIAAVGVGLLFAMAWRMGMAIREKPFFLPFTALIVAAIAVLRWPMPIVMVAGLVLSGAVAWWRLGRK